MVKAACGLATLSVGTLHTSGGH